MDNDNGSPAPFVLGIDLGTNSLGWAVIALDDGKPTRLIRGGARVFDAGMEGDIASGREESRNLKRRQMRLQRRQCGRRARRHRKVFRLLQNWGLLPERNRSELTPLQDILNELDLTIANSPWFAAKRESGAFKQPGQVLPYILRAVALDEALPAHCLGRAVYHLAQRRGFKSNRKAAPKRDEKPGEVVKGISELRDGMAQTCARTLGEYFAHLDPSERRIRQRWTARAMYEDEFKQIWDAQAPHHPEVLTPERRKALFSAIFYQRPLWFPDDLVGTCELEPGEPRAPKYSFLAQRFRLLQDVNNLRLQTSGTEQSLTAEERAKLVQELELAGDQSFAQARKLLKLPQQSRFTIEKGDEKALRGNRTTSEFYKVFGKRWLEMSASEHEQALHDVLSIQNEDALKRRATKHWKLDETAAGKFAKIPVEPDYFNLSVKAINKLIPKLEQGAPYAEARRQLYPEKFEAREPLAALPRLDSEEAWNTLGEIRNPAVTRSLTELRKVVNAIVRQYGKPAEIRIELARDLKRSKKDRQSLTERNRDNEKAREQAKRRILEEAGVPSPRRDDVRKALLWEECSGICPYTGKGIPFRSLFGDSPQFDIEHIIPFDRCFDNSFANLTLCENQENRHVKGRKTPWEAYSGDPNRYAEILDRVKRFHSPSARGKLWRFQMTETEATEFVNRFVNRQLNDTRYASKVAAKYVGMLYGGLSDTEHTRRVHVTSGEVTAQLRNSWKLNAILNDGTTAGGGVVLKSRDDHRHHAVDALATALTDDSTIQQLSRAAALARDGGQRRLGSLEGPWPDFVDSVRSEIDRVVISHRVSRKVSGALHEETIYSPPFSRNGAAGETVRFVRVRKALSAITSGEIRDIVDGAVRARVQDRLTELGGGDPKRAFGNQENLPYLQARDGRRIPIKSVRVEKRVPAKPLGEGRTVRHVTSESNHHIELFAELRPDGSEGRWNGEVVSMLDAYRRKRAGKPIVERDHGPLAKFKFSLAPGEVIECDNGSRDRRLLVVRGLSCYTSGQIVVSMVQLNEARPMKEMTPREFLRPGPDGLRRWHARKVAVTPLGDLREAND